MTADRKPLSVDRRFIRFRLTKEPTLSSGQAEFVYARVVKLGGKPGSATWVTRSEVVNAVEHDREQYIALLDPTKNVAIRDSVYHWLMVWSRANCMDRE